MNHAAPAALAPAATVAVAVAPFRKVCRLGTIEIGRSRVSVYVRIELTADGRLSICGVEGPLPSGNCRGGCGQIAGGVGGLAAGAFERFAPGWDYKRVARLFAIWRRWHLNDMRAGSPAQMAHLRAHPVKVAHPASHYDAAKASLEAAGLSPDPADGYVYGSAWRREEVPAAILDELRALPSADRAPAWV